MNFLLSRISKKRLLILFLLLALGSLTIQANCQTASTETTIIYPEADTYVRSTGSDADINFGADSIIKARYSTSSAYHELGLLKYNLSNYTSLQGQVIDSVRLIMTLVYEQVQGAYVTILGIPDNSDNWNAGTVTWNNGRPDTTTTIATASVPQLSTQVASQNGIQINWDITSRFIDELNNGNKTLSLAVFTKKNSGANTYFLSSESAIVTYRPQLKVFSHNEGVNSGIRNLNVVYFVPSNSDTVPQYRERLNGILFQAQNFYKKWMAYYGYGDRSFGLRRDELGRVKIVVIHGQHEKTYYPYDGGGSKARTEIEAYYASHPEDKQSTHTLVMMPPNIDSTGKEDVPFYGIGGGWCFALDNPNIDTSYTGSSNYIGGMIHELGHGLNLPHVRQKVSELADPAKGTSLMGSGNYTYNKSQTFLTASSCAILNNCEVFAAVTPPADLYEETSASLVTVHGSYSNGSIIVNGTYHSTKPVDNIVVYNDPEGGSNYDRESWVSAPIATDSFSVVMPISELHKKEGNYRLVIALLCGNGATKEFNFNYYFENNEPVIDIQVDNYIDTTGSKVFLTPVDDSYAIYSDRTNTHGTDSLIQTRYSLASSNTYNKIGYLKFDLNSLNLPAGAVIKNILLQAKLQYHQVSTGYKINVLSVADNQDSWSESALTWDNRPDTITTIASSTNQPEQTWLNWVVTDAAINELNSGNGILSLAVYTELNSAANTWFYSKESAHTEDHPKLMVVYSVEGTNESQSLPVHLLKLSARRQDHVVVLNWTTNAGGDHEPHDYLIQRSIDGLNYRNIARVRPSEAQEVDGSYKMSYRYHEIGTERTTVPLYYRIAESADNDNYRFSNISMVSQQLALNNQVNKVYPNPASRKKPIYIDFNNITRLKSIDIRLTDATGRQILNQSFVLNPGTNRLQLDLSSVHLTGTTGIYFLSLKDQSNKPVGKQVQLLLQ